MRKQNMSKNMYVMWKLSWLGLCVLVLLCMACHGPKVQPASLDSSQYPEKRPRPVPTEKQTRSFPEQGREYTASQQGGSGFTESGLPVDYQDFKRHYAHMGRTPAGAAKLYFDAIFCYMNPETRAEAAKMLRYCMRMPRDWQQTHRRFVERMENSRYAHIFCGYAAGSSVQEGYRMSPENYQLDIVQSWPDHPSGNFQLMLRNSGADSPRPLYLRQYDGLWFVADNVATYLDVRRPQTEKDRTGHDANYDEFNYGYTL